MEYAMGLGAITGLMGSNAQTDVMQANLKYQKQMGAFALLGRKYLASKIGVQSPEVAAAYGQNVSSLSRIGAANQRKSMVYWGSPTVGNVGRGRGEMMRNAVDIQRAKNDAAIQYATTQRGIADKPAEVLSGMENAGNVNSAAQGYAQAVAQPYENISSLMGMYASYMMMRNAMKPVPTPASK
jgi:hypothetical protein